MEIKLCSVLAEFFSQELSSLPFAKKSVEWRIQQASTRIHFARYRYFNQLNCRLLKFLHWFFLHLLFAFLLHSKGMEAKKLGEAILFIQKGSSTELEEKNNFLSKEQRKILFVLLLHPRHKKSQKWLLSKNLSFFSLFERQIVKSGQLFAHTPERMNKIKSRPSSSLGLKASDSASDFALAEVCKLF